MAKRGPGVTIKKDLLESAFKSACRAQKKAYAPYSKFHVGAAVITKMGKVYAGSNVENASYGATVCGERVAVFRAVQAGCREIAGLVLVTDGPEAVPPCGMCLQVLSEFCTPETRIWLATPKGIVSESALKEFLPKVFDRSKLG